MYCHGADSPLPHATLCLGPSPLISKHRIQEVTERERERRPQAAPLPLAAATLETLIAWAAVMPGFQSSSTRCP